VHPKHLQTRTAVVAAGAAHSTRTTRKKWFDDRATTGQLRTFSCLEDVDQELVSEHSRVAD
jgi:hypothetical protein